MASSTSSTNQNSNMPETNKIEYTEETIINFVSQLYSNPALAPQASTILTQFQQHPSAWGLCISILNQHSSQISQMISTRTLTINDWESSISDSWAPSSPTNEILFFASQTLCAQAQAGFPQQLAVMNIPPSSAFQEIRKGLCNLIYNYRYGPRQTLQQLTIALCSCLMFSFNESGNQEESPIQQVISIFDNNFGVEGYELLLNIFTILPQEIFHQRVAIGRKIRQDLIKTCLVDVPKTWQLATKIYEEAEASLQSGKQISSNDQIPTSLMKKGLNCFNQWVFAYLVYFISLSEHDPENLAQHSEIMDEIFVSLYNVPLFNLSIKNLTSNRLDVLQICSDAILRTLALSQSCSPPAMQMLNYILSSFLHIFHILQNNNSQFFDTNQSVGFSHLDSAQLVTITHPLVEFTKVHFSNLLYYDTEHSKANLHQLASHMTQLLKNPDFNVKQQSLDFWYNLLSHQFKAISESSKSSNNINLPSELSMQRELLKPLFQSFADAMLEAIAYPLNVKEEEDFDFEGFQKFRDDCSINLTESTLVLSYQYLLTKAGEEFLFIMSSNDQSKQWHRLEICLFVLTTVAERAPAGEDSYIPKILQILPSLPYEQTGILGLILRRTAARLIMWTAGYIGKKSELFVSLFDLVARSFTTFIDNFEAKSSFQESEKKSCESTITNTLNSLTESAGQMLISEGDIQDVHYVLDTLTKLIVTDSISTENRASLIVAAGSVLSYLNKSTLQELFYALVEPLSKNALSNMSEESLRLYFTALHCVRNDFSTPPPPHVPNVMDESDGHSHPVLNVLQKQWPAIEQIIFDNRCSESILQYSNNSIVSIFSTFRVHITHHVIFSSFLDLIGRSFVKHPSVYHLATLRTLIGMFSNVPSEEILAQLGGSLQICVDFILTKFQEKGEDYVFLQPDLIGMTVDCVNNALFQPMLTLKIINQIWFISLCQAVIQFTPTCLHPKVLHTYMVFLSKLVAWVQPPPHLFSPSPGFNVSWIQASITESKRNVIALIESTFGPNNSSYLHGIINAVIMSITNYHTATQSWIGNAAQALLPLINHPTIGQKSKESLRLIILEISPEIMSDEKKDIFYSHCLSETQPRKFADMLMTTVEETQAQYRRAQFKIN